MIVYDRSTLEKLYNACITDNINLEIGIYEKKGDHWEYIPPHQDLEIDRDYKAIFKLSNIGVEIDFKDVQLRVKKTEETLALKLYRELGRASVERVDFKDIPELKSPDGGRRKPTEVYRTVYFRPEVSIKADERHKLFRPGVYATIVPQGHHWYWAKQHEFSAPMLHIPEDTLSFGDVAVSRRTGKKISLYNIGNTDLKITGVRFDSGNELRDSDNDFWFRQEPHLPVTLEPQIGVLLMTIIFEPSGLGNKHDGVTITCDDPANPTATVRLVGNGVHSFRAESETINFGEVPVSTTATRQLRLLNDGQEEVEVTDIQVSGSVFAHFSCEASLPLRVGAGSDVVLDIAFSPSKTVGCTGTLTVVSSYSPKSEIEIALKGTGIHWLTANPRTIDFGGVSLNQWHGGKTTIKNIGPSSCDITRLMIMPALGAEVEFKLGPLAYGLPFTLESSDSFDVPVLAKPTGLGVQRGNLVINYSRNGISRSLSVKLRVTGV